MSYVTERDKSGREPVHFCELDMDICSRAYDPTDKTTLEYNPNLLTHSEDLEDALWVKDLNIVVTEDAVPGLPSVRVGAAFQVYEPGVNPSDRLFQVVPAATLTTNAIARVSFYVHEGSSTTFSIGLYDTTAFAWRARIDFQWIIGSATIKSQDVGTGYTENMGNGWYRCTAIVPVNQIIGANQHIALFYTTEEGVVAGAPKYTYASGAMLEDGNDHWEYMVTDARDGTYTNIRVEPGMTVDEWIGDGCFIGAATHNLYPIIDSGTQHVRVTGNASGEGLATDVHLGGCPESGVADARCHGTLATCNAKSFYDVSDTSHTDRFCEPRDGIPPSAGAMPMITNVDISPPSITLGEGLGVRGSVKVTFQDAPDHDRLTDPFVGGRTYDPMQRGTYWGKWLARNLYRQNRVMRIKSGYISRDGFDLVNDFETRTYLIDNVSGPNPTGLVTVTGKDMLKLADDARGMAPGLTTATLVLTLGSGITGNRDVSDATEFGTSGYIRINDEVMSYTYVDTDTLNITTRGLFGTDDVEHAAGDTIQECLYFDEVRVDDALYTLMVTYNGVDPTILDVAGWAQEVDDWLSAHSLSAIITSPEGTRKLIDEICKAFLLDLWPDVKNALIRMKVLAPPTAVPTVLTDENALIENSVHVKELPKLRASRSWVYWNVVDPTKSMTDPTNFQDREVVIDAPAETAAQHGEKRVRNMYVRWFNTSGDAVRLSSRVVWRYRDNPRQVTFEVDASVGDDLSPGDVVALETDAIQDASGARINTWFRLTEVHEIIGGHRYKCKGLDDKWTGRYWRITPSTYPDWSAATDEQKALGGWIGDSNGELDGEPGYLVV